VSGTAAIASSTAAICSGQPVTCELSILAGVLILLIPFVLHDIYKEVTSTNFDNLRSSAAVTSDDGVSHVRDECAKSANDLKSDSGDA